MKSLVIRSVAESDIHEAVAWFNRERGQRIAINFLDAVDVTFQKVKKNQKMFALVELEIRWALVGRFPYGFFYVDGPEVISVLAVMHLSRNPDTWKDQL